MHGNSLGRNRTRSELEQNKFLYFFHLKRVNPEFWIKIAIFDISLSCVTSSRSHFHLLVPVILKSVLFDGKLLWPRVLASQTHFQTERCSSLVQKSHPKYLVELFLPLLNRYPSFYEDCSKMSDLHGMI